MNLVHRRIYYFTLYVQAHTLSPDYITDVQRLKLVDTVLIKQALSHLLISNLSYDGWGSGLFMNDDQLMSQFKVGNGIRIKMEVEDSVFISILELVGEVLTLKLSVSS